LEDDEHAGPPRTVRTELNIQKIAMLMRADCCQTVDKATAAGISHGIYHKIPSDDLNMYCVTQHSVPRIICKTSVDNSMNTCDR
jgi:hypothetical protein